MEVLQHSTLRIGADGISRSGERFGAPPQALADCNGADVVVTAGADGAPQARLRPRGFFRRWGYSGLDITLAGTAGSVTGSRDYCYVYTDTGGGTYISQIKTITLAAEDAVISGWPTGIGGTVAIYRNTAGSRPLQLVTSGLAASTASYTDSGAASTNLPTWDSDKPQPINTAGAGISAEAMLVDWMGVFTPVGLTRRLGIFARASGGTSGYYFEAEIDVAEVIDYFGLLTVEADRPLSVARFKDTLWIGAGGANLAYRRPTSPVTLGAATQPSAPTLAANATPQVAGALSAATGHVYLAVARHLETGIRSTAAVLTAFQMAYASKKNRLDITVPAGTEVLLYRTSDGGVYYQYLATIAATTTPYADEASDASLSQDTWKAGDAGAMDGVRYVALHKNALFGFVDTYAPTSNSRLRWTHPLYPANVPSDPQAAPQYERYIDREDGDEGSGLWPWGDVLLVFKKRRCFVVLGDPPSLRYEPIAGSEEMGNIAFRTTLETRAGVFYWSPSGIARMAQPGAAPEIVSQELGEFVVEPQRRAQLKFDAALAEEPPAVDWRYAQPSPIVNNPVHFRVQFSTTSNFAAIAADYDTDDNTDRPYFRANHAPVGTAGVTAAALSVVQMTVFPPVGGLTAGTTYYVRYATKASGGSWGSWTSLPQFTMPHDGPLDDDINWDKIQWAFGVHWATRSEVWFWAPTGSRTSCDLVLIGCYEPLLRGLPMRWRIDRIPATCATVVPKFSAAGNSDALLIASPEGFLFHYPYQAAGIDCDTRVTVAEADRYVSGCTYNSGTGVITASGTSWPISRYGLLGTLVAVRDANGACYVGRVTANTATTLTVSFATGRLPPASGLEVAVGGLAFWAESHWFQIGSDAEHAAIVRQIIAHSEAGRARPTITVQTSDSNPRGAQTPQQRVRSVLLGGEQRDTRVPINLRGGNARVRVAEIRINQVWEMSALGLAVEPTESRR